MNKYPLDAGLLQAIQIAWTSSNHGSAQVTEQGGSIIRTINGTRDYRLTRSDNSGIIPFASFPQPVSGETMIGIYHTPPYTAAQGSHLSVAFSGAYSDRGVWLNLFGLLVWPFLALIVFLLGRLAHPVD